MTRQCEVLELRLSRLFVGAGKNQNVKRGLGSLKSTLQHQCRIRAKQSGHTQVIATDGFASAIPNHEPEVGMRAQSAMCACKCQFGFEMNGLRQLDDSVIREPLDDGLAEALIDWPDGSEISATMKQDLPKRHSPAQCGFVKGRHIARVAEIVPSLSECDDFARPDGTVADIAMVWKIEQSRRHSVDQGLGVARSDDFAVIDVAWGCHLSGAVSSVKGLGCFVDLTRA